MAAIVEATKDGRKKRASNATAKLLRHRRPSNHAAAAHKVSKPGHMSKKDRMAKFAEVTALDVAGQANAFLLRFAAEFTGKFDEILEVGHAFQPYAMKSPGTPGEADEMQAHIFFEKRGEVLTVSEMRDKMKDIDLDKNHNMAFIEYLLFTYDKTVQDLLDPSHEDDPALVAMLESAIAEYQKVLAEADQRAEQMEKLEAKAAKGGVKAIAAKHELEAMKTQDETDRRRRELTAAAAKKKLARQIKKDTAGRKAKAEKEQAEAAATETARLEKIEREKVATKRKQKEASRARLAARAAMFNK